MRSLARHWLLRNKSILIPMIRSYKTFLFPFCLLLLGSFMSCNSIDLGQKVKEPFSGGKYESNNRFYRGTGKGMSKIDNVAQSQAEMRARQQLAQQVQSYFEVVTDDYQKNTSGEFVDEAMMRFETLGREITSAKLADMRVIGMEKYIQDDGSYTVYVAIEIKKSAMYRQMKKQAKLSQGISEGELAEIERLLDQLIEESESE